MMRACLGTLALIILASTTAWAEEDFLSPQPLSDAGLVKYWQLRLTLDKGQHLQDIYLVEDHLYIGTQDGYVFAIHAPTGVLRWLRPVTRSGYALRRPCRAGDRVIFTTPTDLQMYDARSGDPVSRYEFRFPAGTAPVSDGTLVYIGGLDRRLYAFEVESQLMSWRVLTNGALSSTPALHGEQIYFANDNGVLYSCTRARRVFRWQTSVYERVSADLVVGDQGIYVASRDFSLYLLDFEYGTVRWRTRLSGPLDEAPVVTADVAYQYCPSDGVVAISAGDVPMTDERVRWNLPTGRTALTVHDNHVYVLTKDQTIVMADVKSGDVGATVPAAGFTLAAPDPTTATVFVASPDGRVFCARPLNVPPLQPADVLAALRTPGQGKEPATTTSQPTTRPAGAGRDELTAEQRGAPVGGKSKVSQQFPGGNRKEPE